MTQYKVTGMSCAACQARVEKAVMNVPEVSSCAVSLLTNSMGVEGNADANAVIEAVKAAGYGAELKDEAGDPSADYEKELLDVTTPKIKKRLIASLVLLIPLMYVSMGHMLFGWPVPALFEKSHMAAGIYEMILAAAVMAINNRFFVSGFRSLFHGAPNMDTLVAIGASASFCYSIYALVAGEELYFESAAMILTLITVGKLLESVSKGRTTNALKELMKLAPKTATVIKDGVEEEVAIENVKTGDLFVLRPGSSVPVDGTVEEGSGAVNESALTGESIPVEKAEGDPVSAATINVNGRMVCRATRVGKDTTLSQIIKMVSDAAATKAPIAKTADRVSGVFVPVVMAIALVTFIIWLATGKDSGFALSRAVSVLVISCPCALGLATPVAIMVGNGVGARSGIMFKTAVSLEEMGKIRIAALDKTGTITKGEPEVRTVYAAEGSSDDELLDAAFALESCSEHPLAKAVVKYCEQLLKKPAQVSDFRALSGNGLTAMLDKEEVCAGNHPLISSKVNIDEKALRLSDELSENGQTPLFFSKGERFLGIITVADVVRPDSKEAIADLKNMGIHVVMLTGDNEKTARAIAKEAGVDEKVAGVRPDGKADVIKQFMKNGKTAMVGDGINDAPALTCADMGIAIGAGTDVAIDAADIVLVKSRLSDVAAAVRLSRATLRNIHENLFWAFIYNIIGIPIAAGVLIPRFGIMLNPMFAAAAMSLSSFCVVTNALRLNLFDIFDKAHDTKHQKPVTISEDVKSETVNKTMGTGTGYEMTGTENVHETTGTENVHETTGSVTGTDKKKEDTSRMEINVNGMMCAHCEAHVKEALEKLDNVVSAAADHEKNVVALTTSGDVKESDLKAAVEAAGYEFAGIR